MTKIISSSTEDALLDWEVMYNMFLEKKCWLVMLDDWQISLLLSLLRYAHWSKRWINLGTDWDSVEASVCQLEACLMSGCDVSELNTNLETIVSKLGEITTAISNLELSAVCSPSITVNTPMTVNCMTQGTGEQPPSQSGEEGEDPPEGWIEPEETTFDRKCYVANFIFDNILETITFLDDNNVGAWTGIGAGFVIGLVIACFTLLTGPLAVAIAIAGVAATAAGALMSEEIDLPELKTILQTEAQDFICALYIATDAESARELALNVLKLAGANFIQRDLVKACLINDVVNSLFFERDDDYGLRLKEALETYTPSYSCLACESSCPWEVIPYWGTQEKTGENEWYLTSEFYAGVYYIQAAYNIETQFLSTFVLTDWQNSPYQDFRYYFDIAYTELIYEGDEEQSPITCSAWIITSAVPFTAVLTIDCGE